MNEFGILTDAEYLKKYGRKKSDDFIYMKKNGVCMPCCVMYNNGKLSPTCKRCTARREGGK